MQAGEELSRRRKDKYKSPGAETSSVSGSRRKAGPAELGSELERGLAREDGPGHRKLPRLWEGILDLFYEQ